MNASRAVSPRMRGFTERRARSDEALPGFSAHARVHRALASPRNNAHWFPRVRAGYRPRRRRGQRGERVLPRVRGFTGVVSLLRQLLDGSSAQARVHRSGCSTSTRSARFFPARVGSPRSLKPVSQSTRVLPRTRGFTDRHLAVIGDLVGSSAHARVQGSECACPTTRAGRPHPALP